MSDGTTTGMLNLVFNKYQSAVIVLTGHVLRRLDLSNHSLALPFTSVVGSESRPSSRGIFVT